jgi:GTPase
VAGEVDRIGETGHPLRFRRHHRRPQRRQVDAAQPARRLQARHRHPEGADDAHRLRGIVIEGDAQIIFVDTPGIFTPRRSLDEAMVQAAWAGAADADTVLLIVDARFGLDEQAELVIAGLEKAGVKPVLVLNKIDLIRREPCSRWSRRSTNAGPSPPPSWSARCRGDGVADLKAHVAAHMPPGPWLYPEDQVADVPLRLLAAEITREKIFLRLHEELPYASTVETESWKERKDGSVRVDQVIYVEREGQRKIVLGKNGQTIKAIGQAARTEIAELIGQPVHLFLFVKVRSTWAERPRTPPHHGPGTPAAGDDFNPFRSGTKQYGLAMRRRPGGALPGVAAGVDARARR